MDREELEKHQVLLSQSELALAADPSNAELASLCTELRELISLTEAAIALSESQAASTSKPDPSHRNGKAAAAVVETWAAGNECLAKYSGDGSWYPARITSLGGSSDNRVYSIVFKGYNTTELVKASEIKPLPTNTYGNPYGSAALSATSNKRKLTKAEEEEREKKKKKNEKKVEAKAAKAKEQMAKQQTWQKFAKKAEKKGVTIAGVTGTSIFKTPDNPLGRVGVTGSGKGMTDAPTRGKHVFTGVEEDP